MLLYDHAQLDGDNSELDALKRLALSHESKMASLGNSAETSPLPTLPVSAAFSASKQPTKKAVAATAVAGPSADVPKVKVELAAAQHPPSAKSAKLLLIPGSLSAVTKQHAITTQSHSAVQKHEPMVSGCGTVGQTKRRIQSDGGLKSVPLGDVMNVRSASAHEGRQSLVSFVPLSSDTSLPSHSQGKSEWNQQVRIKLEPGISGTRAGKRKQPLVPGMLHRYIFTSPPVGLRAEYCDCRVCLSVCLVHKHISRYTHLIFVNFLHVTYGHG